MTHITQENLNDFYLREDGSVWRIVMYANAPTVTLERIYPDQPTVGWKRETISGVVGAPIFDGFRQLVAKEPA